MRLPATSITCPRRAIRCCLVVLTLLPGLLVPTAFGQPAPDQTFTFPGGFSLTLGADWRIRHADPTGGRQPAFGANWVSTRLLLLAVRSKSAKPVQLSVYAMESPGAELSVRYRQRALLGWLCGMTGTTGFLPDNLEAASAEAAGNPVIFAEIHTGSVEGGRVRHMATELEAEPGKRLVMVLEVNDADRETVLPEIFKAVYRGIALADLRGKAGIPVDGAAPTTPSLIAGTGSPAPSGSPALAFATPAMSGERAAELATTTQPSLAVVEGPKGRGSAFLWRQGSETWAITNSHVLAGNPGARLLTVDGRALQARDAFAAVEHDLCRIRIADAPPGLATVDAPDTEIKIGDPILVLGNSEGAGVVAPLPGRIVGIGPRLVEVDAPFVPGNSGSPIVHEPTGKVIGVATYLTTRSIDPERPGAVQEKVRRFGFRLDSVTTWEPIDWNRFQGQAAATKAIEETSGEFIRLFEMARKDNIRSGSFRTPGIRRALESMEVRMAGGGRSLSPTDLADVRRRLLADLRAATRADLLAFDRRTAYDYFRRKVEEEERFRTELYEHFSRAIDARVR